MCVLCVCACVCVCVCLCVPLTCGLYVCLCIQKKARWVTKYNDALDALNCSGEGAVDVVLCPVHVLPTHKHGEAARKYGGGFCWVLSCLFVR